jgi:uncharacterized protein YxjI
VKGLMNGRIFGIRYLIRERAIAARDGFCVADESGRDILRVDGEGQHTFALTGPDGAAVTTIRKQLIAMRENMEIERAGAIVAIVRKALVSHMHHRFVVDLAAGGELEAHGDIPAKEFDIRSGGAVLAQVSRAWSKVKHSYGVEVASGEGDHLLLTVALCLDRIHRDEAARRLG